MIFKAKLEVHDDKTFRKWVFKCDLDGHYEQKLSHPTIGKLKNKGSKKIGCEWQINITKCKKSSLITIILVKDTHNHNII